MLRKNDVYVNFCGTNLLRFDHYMRVTKKRGRMKENVVRNRFFEAMNRISQNNWELSEDLVSCLYKSLEGAAIDIKNSLRSNRMLNVEDINQELFLTCLSSIHNKKFIKMEKLKTFTYTRITRKYFRETSKNKSENEKIDIQSIDYDMEIPSKEAPILFDDWLTIDEYDLYKKLIKHFEPYKVEAWFLLKIKKWPQKIIEKEYKKIENFQTFLNKYCTQIQTRAQFIIKKEFLWRKN